MRVRTIQPTDSAMRSGWEFLCTRALSLGVIFWGALTLSVMLGAADVEQLTEKLRSADGEMRRSGWASVTELGAAAVAPLVQLVGDENPDTALAASRALGRLVASVTHVDSKAKKQAVSSALVAALQRVSVVTAARVVAIELLGQLGEPDAVPMLAAALMDTRLREKARRSLIEFPGEEATQALIDALPGNAGPFREALLIALGSRVDDRARKTLRKLLSIGPISERRLAVSALARVGDEADIERLLAAMESFDEMERAVLGDDLLVMADRFVGQEKRASAARLCEGVFTHALHGPLRGAALKGWCGDNPAEHIAEILDVLAATSASPVHEVAFELLSQAQSEDVDGQLFAAYGTSTGLRKATLLRVLQRRDTPGSLVVLQRAREDQSADVRVTAFELLAEVGTVDAERAFALGFAHGSEGTRRRAGRRYLQLADRKASEAAMAREMYRQAMEVADDPIERGRALIGLANLGDPTLPRWLEKSRDDPRMQAAVTEAELYLARAMGLVGQTEGAIEKLMAVVRHPGMGAGVRQEAVQLIHELGGDAKAQQCVAGYLTDWWVLGPFPNKNGNGLRTTYSPEQAVDLQAQVDHRQRLRRWRKIETLQQHGLVDFSSFFRRSHHVIGYAYAEIKLAKDREVVFHLGSSGAVVLWLNGERLIEREHISQFEPETMKMGTQLQRGTNRILIKVANDSGEWRFGVRLLSPAGAPIDLTGSAGR